MLRLIRQTLAVITLNARAVKPAPALVLAAGFFGVVLVFVAVLSIRQGFAQVMSNSGSPDVAYVYGNGDNMLTEDELAVIAQAPGVAEKSRRAEMMGSYLATAQIPVRGAGVLGSALLRGVSMNVGDVWAHFHITAGRMFRPGLDEIIVGRHAERLFAGLHIGDTLQWNRHSWKVVGIFAMSNGIHESEIWTDVRQLQQAYNASGSYRVAMVRLSSVGSFRAFKRWVEHNPQLNVTTSRADQVWQREAGNLDGPIEVVGGVVTLLMATGAIFGAVNVMYANVDDRLRLLATLRALGFTRFPILCTVLMESMLFGLAGGALAAAVAFLLLNGLQTSTIANGAMVAFSFAVTPGLVFTALILALVMGFCGGLFPAVYAARRPIVRSLRDA